MANEETGTTPVVDPTETDFAALSDMSLEHDEPEIEPAAVAAPAVVEPPATKVEAPPVVTPPPTTPVVTLPVPSAPVPPQPAAPVQQPAAAIQPSAAPTAPTQEQFLQQRTALLTDIQGRYVVSDADAERYMTEPHKVLPELAARVMLDTFDATLAVVTPLIPRMIEEFITQRNVGSEVQKAFFTQWPQLEKPEYAPHIQKAAMLYKQMNPNVPMQKALSDIGVWVATALGVPLQPVVPSVPAPAPVVRSVPFVPGGMASPPATPTATEPNIFAHLATLSDED
jgi:hypothetical protein